MSKKAGVANIESIERRKKWQDRRKMAERRNSIRLHLSADDCRSGLPRRESDLSGKLADGDVWWNKDTTQYE